MRKDCIRAVEASLGRALKVNESRDIEKLILRHKNLLASKDPNYPSYSTADRLRLAADNAAAEVLHLAIKKRQRTSLIIGKKIQLETWQAGQNESKINGIERLFQQRGDGNDNIQSANSKYKAVFVESVRGIVRDIEAFGPKMLGIINNDKAMIPVFKALRGDKINNPKAEQFAIKIAEKFEKLRVLYNSLGGNVGLLEDFGTPQSHSSVKVFLAGRKKWKKIIRPLLDESRYLDENGNLRDMDAFLDHAYESIVYGNLPSDEFQGIGALANRGAKHRELHFKNADSYLIYHKQFSDKTLMATLIGHIDGISKDISMIDVLGPNPRQMLDTLLAEASIEAKAKNIDPVKFKKKEDLINNLYNQSSGIGNGMVDPVLARRFDNVGNVSNFLLGGAGVTSFFTDPATILTTAKAFNVSGWKALYEEFKSLSSRERIRQAQGLGLGIEGMLGSIQHSTQSNLLNAGLTKASGAVIRAGGLQWVTTAGQQGFGIAAMHGIGQATREYAALADLPAHDYRHLLSKGLTEETWSIWKEAKLDGNGLLTPDGINSVRGYSQKQIRIARDALLGAVLEETDNAVVNIGPKQIAQMKGGITRGTYKGEIYQSALKFKSFPFAIMSRHWVRAASESGNFGTAKYAAGLITAGLIGGAMAVQMNELENFRDPFDMRDPGFWVKALLKSGSLSFFGDFIGNLSSVNQHGQSLASGVLGPAAGLVEEAGRLTVGNVAEALAGEDTHFGAEAIKLGARITPGTTVWWAKGVINHMVLQNLQESISPGYLRKIQARNKKVFKHSEFAKPGKLPERAPNLKRAIGIR